MRGGPIVVCSECGSEVRRLDAWQAFRLLRHLGTTGGGRQRTIAGKGEDVYYCGRCARLEDLKARGLAPTGSLFGDER